MLPIASFYSIFQPLTDVFQSVLKFFHNSGGISWGWSIVLLTILVRAILVPITLRQLKGMARMQMYAPQLKAIQTKYKNDKQRQQEEMMKFYRENHINPFASCLPLLLQFPVFIALYAMLRQSLRTDICPGIQRAHNHGVLSIHHTVACGNVSSSHFLFVHDLTSKATGLTLVVLLVLYVGSQLSSSMIMAQPTMDPTQRRMMMLLPLFFVAFIFRFPAGLIVYWVTTNLWTVGQSAIVRQRLGTHRAALEVSAAEAGAGRGPSGGGARANGEPEPSPSGGGFGAMFRDRLRAAQDAAAEKNSGDGGGRRGPAGTATKAAPKTRSSEGQPKSEGNGGTGARGGAGAPDGNGKGSSGKAGAPPPRPPRKKKKRSGRRR